MKRRVMGVERGMVLEVKGLERRRGATECPALSYVLP